MGFLVAARVGVVLYWFGCIVAVPFALWAIVNAFVLLGFFGGISLPGENMQHVMTSILAAVAAWLGGRACRYLLAGT